LLFCLLSLHGKRLERLRKRTLRPTKLRNVARGLHQRVSKVRSDIVGIQGKNSNSVEKGIWDLRVVMVRRLEREGVFAKDLLNRLELGAVGRKPQREHATRPDEGVDRRRVN